MTQVKEKVVYTLQEIEKKLGVAQYRLIHLCEKKVVIPDFEDASGRGTMRRFSERNLFEFALALELRRYSLPVAYIVPVMKVLRAFETHAAREIEVFNLPRSLQNKPAVRLSIVITEGRNLFFILRHRGETSYIGALDLEISHPMKGVRTSHEDPTHPFVSRLEVDLTKIAQSLS